MNQVEEAVKYAGYIRREEQEIARLQEMEGTRLPTKHEYLQAEGVSRGIKTMAGSPQAAA